MPLKIRKSIMLIMAQLNLASLYVLVKFYSPYYLTRSNMMKYNQDFICMVLFEINPFILGNLHQILTLTSTNRFKF